MRVIKGFNVVSSTSALNPFCAGTTCGPRPCRGRIWPFWPSFSTPKRMQKPPHLSPPRPGDKYGRLSLRLPPPLQSPHHLASYFPLGKKTKAQDRHSTRLN